MAGRITPSEGRYGGRNAAERRAERRERFRTAGLDLFGAGPGYRATRLGDLCKAAGLSTRQFYEEYRTLEDLLADLHLHVNEIAESAVLDVLPQVQELPLAERVTACTRAYLGGAAGDMRHARITYVEIVGVSPRINHQRLRRRAIWIELLNRLADEAVERGEAPPDDYRLASAALIGAINGLMHDWVVGWVNASREEIADELVRIILGRYGPTD
ncbi:TetR/AcrR family transcriptional regulator [Streptomyces sp. OfavH-34-F]|uniref:TetR/AcrR family transcriptional regulator n=1 Tax=Streptomyces sp. OfavH-34-F TaxID=2917760 RepID=UPI001EF21E61|nr:TetR/AcrR family transcriptional regulator [Streptomyces sp. OfavH-34-F]MCG7525914.1 TetR/AcrR family transcriptional regulator [Streptomyces sp. OfavH-34-F]